ncbi:MAG: Ig-like domain-containing protein, partial [Bifidobacteriaceae bacterium]|nr:Ig-like domain-containing protein [Bifidobacteriaceae bacterium]
MSSHVSQNAHSYALVAFVGTLTRLPKRAVKAVALLTAAAIALGGVTLAQSWMSAERADAVRFMNGWDGSFTTDQLWIKAAIGSTNMRAATRPWEIGQFTNVSAPQLLTSNGSDNGLPGMSRATIALGPMFKSQGDVGLHMIDIGTNGAATILHANTSNPSEKRVDGYNQNAAGWMPTCGLTSGYETGADINQQNGYVYAIASASSSQQSTLIAANATTLDGVNPRIIKITKSGSGTNLTFAATCVAQSAGTSITSATGTTLSAQWNALTGQNINSAWRASSDVASDAVGNMYLMLGAGSAQHALLRINVPHDRQRQPRSTGWTFEIVQTFTQSITTSDAWSMAYMNGKLYTGHEDYSYYRWDPLTGAVDDMSSTQLAIPVDMAAAQTVPVISGTVYNDVAGDGSVAGDPGLEGVVLEIWERGSGDSWIKRGETETDADGVYSATLNSASGEHAVRVARPSINGVNASQTYASAGSFSNGASSNPKFNTVTAYCAVNGANYVARAGNGACPGARVDGIDALNADVGGTGNPFAASGGAQIVSRVAMTTDLALTEADFGITAAASWGDAPSVYKTTNAEGGPSASPKRASQNYLYLGPTAGVYPDGSPGAGANAHPSDDGVEMRPIDNSVTGVGDWLPLQDQVTAIDQVYEVRAKASGDPAAVAASTVKGWITPLSGGVAQPNMALPFLGGGGDCSSTPDASGYVRCYYRGPSTVVPSSGVASLYMRARVSSDPGVTTTSRAPSNPATQSWVQYGEVEDYRLGVAGSVIRLRARTLANVAANVNLSLGSNVSATAPSQNTARIATNPANGFVSSTRGHAVVNRSNAVTVTTTGVGGASQTGLNGWRLGTGTHGGVDDTACYDALTGQVLDTTVNAAAGTVTVAPPGGGLPREVSCQLTYLPDVDLSVSTVTAVPSDNEADPIVRPGASTVSLDVKGKVRDIGGNLVETAVEGGSVTLTLAGRAGSGATPTGAHFEYSADGGATWNTDDQSYDCAIDVSGDCSEAVRVVAAVAGVYDLKAQVGSGHLKNLATDVASDTSPVVIAFQDGTANDDDSSMVITRTANQPANHNAPGSTAADWGKQTITVTLKDSGGQPYKDGVAELLASAPLDGGPEGVYYEAADSSHKGVFECAQPEVGGKCEQGVYTLEVYASKSGDKQITVTYTSQDGSKSFNLKDADSSANPKARFVTAKFTTPKAAEDYSVIIFTGPGESNPVDTGEPDDDPDGVGIAQLHGHSYSLMIRAWDAGRQNPIGGAEVEFRVDSTCVGSFPGGLKTVGKITSDDGKASTTLTSTQVGSCDVHGFVKIDGVWQEVAGGDGVNGWKKTATWVDPKISLPDSHFEVSEANVVADDADTGTITVTLKGENGVPVTDAAATLNATGPSGIDLTVDAPFVHQGGGVYQTTFHGKKAGNHQISVKTSGEAIGGAAGRNTLAHLIPGAPDPKLTVASLTVSDDTALANGSAYVEAWMTVQDSNRNPIAGDTGCSFQLPANPGTDTVWFGLAGDRSNPIPQTKVPASGADGRCVVQIRTFTVGEYPVQGMYGPESSPGPDADRPKAKFNLVTPDAAHSWWTVAETPGNVASPPRADGADSHTVTVNLRSISDEPSPLQPVTVHWQLQPNGATATQTVSTDTTGTATWAITTEVKGDYKVWVTTSADQIPTERLGSVYTRVVTFAQGPADPGQTEFSHSHNAQLPLDDVAHSHFAQVLVRDAHGNAVQGEEVYFTLDSSKSAHFIDAISGADLGQGPLALVSSALGIARVLIASPDTEITTVNAHLGSATGPNVGTAALEFADYDPPDPNESEFVITPDPLTNTAVADGVGHFTGTVTIRTKNRVPVAGYHVAFEHNANLQVVGDGVTDSAGQAVVTFKTVKAGLYTVNAKIDANSVPKVDQQLRFVPGDPSPVNSTLYSTFGKALANGLAQQSAWAVVRDVNNNPITGQTVYFSIDPGAPTPGPALGAESAVTCDFADPGKPSWCTETGMALV